MPNPNDSALMADLLRLLLDDGPMSLGSIVARTNWRRGVVQDLLNRLAGRKQVKASQGRERGLKTILYAVDASTL